MTKAEMDAAVTSGHAKRYPAGCPLMCEECTARLAAKKPVRFSEKTRWALKDAIWCVFQSDWGLTYQMCRFCQQGRPYTKRDYKKSGDGLWKYGVRHYACTECRDKALAEHKADMGKLAEALHTRFAQGR